jgi:hypothetical protein
MKRFLKWLLVACISVALVWPVWPILYVLLGGGFIGGAAVIILGTATNWAVGTVIDSTIEFYRWTKSRERGKL